MMLFEEFPRHPMRGLRAFKRDLMRQPPLAMKRPTEKRFGRRDIPLGAQKEIDSLALFVDRAIEVGPAAVDLHIGLVDSPGDACLAGATVPCLSNSGT